MFLELKITSNIKTKKLYRVSHFVHRLLLNNDYILEQWKIYLECSEIIKIIV